MKKGYRKKLLKYQIFGLLVLASIVLDLAIVGISYVTYTKNITAESEKICVGLSEAIATSMNGNRVGDWLRGERMDDYKEGEEQLRSILNSYSDIMNIRVLKMNLNGPRVVYDLSRTRDKTESRGKVIKYVNGLESIKNKLISGEYIGTVFREVNKETVITSITPVTDVANNVTCYAICEIGMKTMKANREDFIKTLFCTILVASVILVCVLNVYINNSVIKPVTKLDYELRKMTSYVKCDEVIEELQALKKRRLAELTCLCDGFINILDDIRTKNMEAESFEEITKERMIKSIEKTSDEDIIPRKKKVKVIIPDTKKNDGSPTKKKVVKVVVKNSKKPKSE